MPHGPICGAVETLKTIFYLNRDLYYFFCPHFRHIALVHTPESERQFKCNYCERRFVFKGHRDDHENSHTGNKPHVCERCGKGFTKRNNLSTHVNRHK